MGKGTIQAYCGYGKGKSAAALGSAVREADSGGNCIIIQFMKKRDAETGDFIRKMEPEIRIFHFQKYNELYDDLSEEQKAESRMGMKNGLNYAGKVMNTRECSLLILDEVLGLIEKKIIEPSELARLIGQKPVSMSLILTGRVLDDEIRPLVDEVFRIEEESAGAYGSSLC